MLRILHIIPTFYPATYFGGPIHSVYGLCNALARNSDLQMRVLTTDSSGPSTKDRLRVGAMPERMPAGYEVYYCAKSFGMDFSTGLLARLVAMIRWADVVHLTGVYSAPTIPTLFLAFLLGKPVVWSPRGALQRWAGSRHIWLKRLWECACWAVASRRTLIHVTSQEEAGESLARFPGFDFAVVPNGVDVPESVMRTASDGRLRLLFMGRLDGKKGLENLIEACRLLTSRSIEEWSLVIAGSGDPRYEQSLRELVEQCGLVSRVRFAGHVTGGRKAALLAESDLLIMPSFTENFGLVVVEALAYGIPVIASTGTPWMRLQDMGCGFWVSNDPDTLAQTIMRARKMPLDEMGRRGREWMVQEFSWDTVAQAIAERYRSLAVLRGGHAAN